MALSCSRLCSRLSLLRLAGVGTATVGVYSPRVSCHLRLTPRLTPGLTPRLTPCRFYSSSKARRGVGRYVSSVVQRANAKYEGFLKRRFPRFYQLYHTFVEGFKLLFRDSQEVMRIKVKMGHSGLNVQDLPYREMEKLRQFRRNVIKGIPLVLISIPPFANYLVFVLMYFFPRQLLIPHFWTPKQQLEFRGVYHSLRVRYHRPVLEELSRAGARVDDAQLRRRLNDLCVKASAERVDPAGGGAAGRAQPLLRSSSGRREAERGSHEEHQPPALPDTAPSRLPDWPAAERPRPGAAAAGPSPEPAGRAAAQRGRAQTGLLHAGAGRRQHGRQPVPRVAAPVAPGVLLAERVRGVAAPAQPSPPLCQPAQRARPALTGSLGADLLL